MDKVVQTVSQFVQSDSLSYYPGFNNGAMIFLWALVLLVGVVGALFALNVMKAGKGAQNRPE